MAVNNLSALGKSVGSPTFTAPTFKYWWVAIGILNRSPFIARPAPGFNFGAVSISAGAPVIGSAHYGIVEDLPPAVGINGSPPIIGSPDYRYNISPPLGITVGSPRFGTQWMGTDPINPGIVPNAGSELLYQSSTGLEKAWADLEGYRLTATYAELVRDQWDPYKIFYRNLPYLAWAMGVNLWEDWWSEEFKRYWVANQWELKYERGSLKGLARFISAVGGTLKRAVTPPAKTFLRPNLTDAELRAYVARFPQLRMYPYVARVTLKYLCWPGGHSYTKLGKPIRGYNGAYVQGLRKMFPTVQTAGGRYTRSATLYDPRTGIETKLTVRRIERIITGQQAMWGFTPGVSAYDEEIVLPIDKRVFYYIRQPKHYLGYNIFAGKQAALRTIRVSRSGPQPLIQAKAQYQTALPSVEFIRLLPEHVFQKHPARKYQMYLAAKRRFIHRAYPMRSVAWQYIWETWYIFDPDRVPDHRQQGRTYLGKTRLGMPYYTAEALVLIRTKFNRRVWMYCGGFIGPRRYLKQLDPEAILRLRRGVTASMAVRDTVLINTTMTRKIELRDVIVVDGTHTVGELVEN